MKPLEKIVCICVDRNRDEWQNGKTKTQSFKINMSEKKVVISSRLHNLRYVKICIQYRIYTCSINIITVKSINIPYRHYN